ncbi:MAG: hypothetical protein CM15mP83_3180 [Flavobacteriaceae bacterium]|nr:MAG: hypothetical protein CM15mP83_3180 [Flavobacteriaceae bacterium]
MLFGTKLGNVFFRAIAGGFKPSFKNQFGQSIFIVGSMAENLREMFCAELPRLQPNLSCMPFWLGDKTKKRKTNPIGPKFIAKLLNLQGLRSLNGPRQIQGFFKTSRSFLLLFFSLILIP